MTGMLGSLTVVAVATVERQAFAVVPVIEYESLEDWREPSLMWVTRARGAVAPPAGLFMLVYLTALTAHASRASWFGSRKVMRHG